MIKKIYFLAIVVTVALVGCKKDGGTIAEGAKDDAAFAAYSNHFLETLWKNDPDRATQTGYHLYDSVLLVPTAKNRDKLLDFAKVEADSLLRYVPASLSDANKIDYQLMQNEVQKIQWTLQTLKPYEWDPTAYNVLGTFAYILNGHYAPLDKRLRSFYDKLENIPEYYREAQKQIKNPVPELTALAADQLNGGADVIAKDFVDSLKKSKIPEATQKLMLARARLSAEAVKGFAAWLTALKIAKPRSFRLGRSLYQEKFGYYIQSELTAQQVYNAAAERKKLLHREMAKLTRELWPKYFNKQAPPADTLEMIGHMIDTLSGQHVKPGDFQSAIEKQIPMLAAFVKDKNLLTLDPSKPLIVRKEPAYMAGVAGASVSAPGPYDKKENTYFNVGSLAGWSPARSDSYLREYNQYILQILCIHEGIPGHYTQLVYANKAPSLIKSVLANGAMIEGWAVYAEEMMLDAGFGSKAPEMRLMWYKWNLRSVCNALLDYNVHVTGMTKPDALKLLTREAFQQQAEAEGKWKRVTVSSVQLTSYYTGYKEITDLHKAWQKKQADKYKLKAFNEAFLSYGSAPVKLIKELMLQKSSTS